MAHPRPAAPSRRVPIQARAHVTVDAVIAATAQILLKEGYDACTTNHVARVAGVSIGSLYQYFPDKEALIIAVMEQHLTRMREFLEARLAQMGDVPLPQAIPEMMRAMLDVHRIQPRLHRVLIEQVPRIGELKRLHELNSEFAPAVTAWLEAHESEISVDSVSVAVFVLIAAVEGVLGRALVHRPGWLEAGVLEKNISRLALAYLAPEKVEGRGGPSSKARPSGKGR
jgi:AcrR family transcriptional regulator